MAYASSFALWWRGNVAKNNKPGFFYGLYSDKPWVFDQSEGAQGPLYITIKTINQVYHKFVFLILHLPPK